jgi:hypothetical protein
MNRKGVQDVERVGVAVLQAAEKRNGTVILRSRRRRRISPRVENKQSEILRCAQNDNERAPSNNAR